MCINTVGEINALFMTRELMVSIYGINCHRESAYTAWSKNLDASTLSHVFYLHHVFGENFRSIDTYTRINYILVNSFMMHLQNAFIEKVFR